MGSLSQASGAPQILPQLSGTPWLGNIAPGLLPLQWPPDTWVVLYGVPEDF